MLDRQTALIAEDEVLIALELEEAIKQAANRKAIASSVSTVSSVAEGLTLIERTKFDFALIDVRLSDGHCDPLLSILGRRGVPFALCSGFHRELLASQYGDLPILTKPYDQRDLRGLLSKLLKPARNDACIRNRWDRDTGNPASAY